ncbi:Glutamyl-tRNA synthetase, Glutamyl-tRNA(Gln) synthetase [Thermogutta terrifontis]|uniref:Glutamate--tRNA ligase n=1 Tax=Thermogutta terrifontis TaxID=1331910 RepID=A0A286RLG3_9BACT|nr:glutamate--tRNA ligase [Thermogutta terrifontis]ASV76781.1 Glutamyl-tRNA synthetase, Glutamyl-tRNA(Gln) synthetase [Thermogutta terrifontis]
MSVRTRFAPSPTGYLHIGGVRTALFCWLFARRHGGQFILRIDDTDQQRNVEEALQPILDGLRWLGIDWDEGPEVGGPHAPYFQSQRLPIYQEAVRRLLKSGHAYWDFATPEEIQAEREAAQAEKRPFVYSRRFMAETEADAARFRAQGRQGVVRLKMPREGKLVINDLIRGPVEFEWSQEQDHVIQRSDGTVLYHLASAVDDHEFGITHVIRAEEHLSNTPRQVFILQSLGYEAPQFAHLPVVAEPGSKVKLSKRKLDKYLKNRDFAELMELGQKIAQKIGHAASSELFNPVIVDFYKVVGFLPDAIVNYLALLGWSLDDKTEHFTREELVRVFSLDRVNKAPASFDPKKLLAFQQRHMREVPISQKVEMVIPYLRRAGWIPGEVSADLRGKIARVVEAAGDRLRVAGEILNYPEFFVADEDLPYDEKDVAKRLQQPGVAEILQRLEGVLREAEPFTASHLETLIHQWTEREQLSLGQVVHPLRVAVTGRSVGFGLFDTLAILGRDTVCRRLQLAREKFAASAAKPAPESA